MFKNEKGCTKFRIADYVCNVPPMGYGWNIVTGLLEETYVIKRSEDTTEQYWQREDLLEDYEKKAKIEKQRQKFDPDYEDTELAMYRQQEWHRRLVGVWFYNHGVPVYLTGLHYFYLQWWRIDVGYPQYRRRDKGLFYLIMLTIFDPKCLGLLYVAKRRDGKSFVAGVYMYERMSRMADVVGGIQSKNDKDAYKFFVKTIRNPWVKLPSFFRPIYNTASGNLPEDGLYFTNTSQTGKAALEEDQEEALGSQITFEAAKASAYDNEKLITYVSDECGKLENVDINVRHDTVRFCAVLDDQFIGKMFYTTTVEDDEDSKRHLLKGNKYKASMAMRFKSLWDDSDPNLRNENGETTSGLYRYLLPAFETGRCDKYGEADTVFMTQYYENMFADARRKGKGKEFSLRRKNPFTPADLFRQTNDVGLFDSDLCNDRIDQITPFERGKVQRGNFNWENGVPNTKVVWFPCANGRWYMAWNFPGYGMSNRVQRRGDQWVPANDENFVMGCDPFSHSKFVDPRRSDGVAFVKRRYNSMQEDDEFNDAPVIMYSARPENTMVFHEDMIKMCMYYGCQCLFENNKNGWEDYFIMRGYGAFLKQIPGQVNIGINGNDKTADDIVNKMIFYYQRCMHKVWFSGLLSQSIAFDFNDRTPFDKVMAFGYTLISEGGFYAYQAPRKTEKVTDFVTTY